MFIVCLMSLHQNHLCFPIYQHHQFFYTAGSRPIDCLCCTSHTFILLQCKTPHVLAIMILIVIIIIIVIVTAMIIISTSSPALSARQGATCALSDSLQCYDTDSRWPTTRLKLNNKPSKIYFQIRDPPFCQNKITNLQDTFSRARHWQASYPSVLPSLVEAEITFNI